MKKRIFGIKLSTILSVFVCLVIAFAIWMIVKYRADFDTLASSCRVLDVLRG